MNSAGKPPPIDKKARLTGIHYIGGTTLLIAAASVAVVFVIPDKAPGVLAILVPTLSTAFFALAGHTGRSQEK